ELDTITDTDRHAPDGSGRNLKIDQFGQLADQRRLRELRARGVTAAKGCAGDILVQTLDLLQKAVGPVDGVVDPAVGVFPDRLDLLADPARLLEQGLRLVQGLLSAGRRCGVLRA